MLSNVRTYVRTYTRSCGVFDVILSGTDVILSLFMCITYVCSYACAYVCMYVHMYVCLFVCMFVCTYVCIGSETAGGGVG